MPSAIACSLTVAQPTLLYFYATHFAMLATAAEAVALARDAGIGPGA